MKKSKKIRFFSLFVSFFKIIRDPFMDVKTCQGWRSWLYSSTRNILEALKYRLRIEECVVKHFLLNNLNMRNHNTPILLFLRIILFILNSNIWRIFFLNNDINIIFHFSIFKKISIF